MRGYLYRRKLALRYRPLNGRPFETLFSIYLIEPSPVGYATYLIGYSEVSGGLRSYKLERVEEARLTGERYQIPADFKGLETLRSAWSIIYGEQTLRVELRFSPQVRARVLETTWHPSQRVAEDAQRPGWLCWEAEVADTLDMLPWIRGWGADCEVLAPEGLREGMEQEAKKLARVYGIGNAKLGDDLIAHRRKDGQEQSLMTHLNETSEWAERFAAKVELPQIGKVMGLLHDFGKGSKEYQDYLRSAVGQINPDEDDYVDFKAMKGKIDHSTAGAQLVYEKLAGRGQEGKILAQFVALALASHHSGLMDCLKPDGTNDFGRRIAKDDKDTHLAEARGKLLDIEKQLDEILARPVEKDFFQVVFEKMTEATDSKIHDGSSVVCWRVSC